MVKFVAYNFGSDIELLIVLESNSRR